MMFDVDKTEKYMITAALDDFRERASIMQYDGRMSREAAEESAWDCIAWSHQRWAITEAMNEVERMRR